jgi:hypothetical protein
MTGNKLTLVTSTPLPQPDRATALPPGVRWEIANYLRAKGLDGWWGPSEYRPEVAPLHAALLARQKQTAPPHVIAAWLRRLSNAATLNMTAEQLVGRIGEMVSVLGNRPAYCWTEETYVAAAERFKFFPSVAEVRELHDETIERDRVAIHVTGALSSEKTRREQEAQKRYRLEQKEQEERRRLEWEREQAEEQAEERRSLQWMEDDC